MKIMIVADPPHVETGYSKQGRSLAIRLCNDGHDVYIYGPGGLQGGSYYYKGYKLGGAKALHFNITVLGASYGDDRAGTDGFGYWLAHVEPDLVINLLDAMAVGRYAWTGVPTWMWAPIDSWPVTDEEGGILGRADRVMVPSVWGTHQCTERGIDAVTVPYGYEATEMYVDDTARRDFRTKLGIDEDTFLVGMVGFHYPYPDRKGFPYGFEAIGRLAAGKGNVKAYIQTELETAPNFLNLRTLRHNLGLDNVIGFAPSTGPRFIDNHEMRALLNSFDVLLNSSISEGFGVPIIEAQACGTPVVINAATGAAELMGPGGAGCAPAGSMFIADGSIASIPSVVELSNGLEIVYSEWLSDTQPRRVTISKWAGYYDWDLLYKIFWKPAIEDFKNDMMVRSDLRSNQRLLVLGCGTRPQDGAINHDLVKHHDYVDVAHDLNILPWPWADNSFDVIDMGDVIEHLSVGVPSVMDECWRILSVGGTLCIRTCAEDSWQFKTDPTHVRSFTLASFDYFDPRTVFGQDYGSAYTDRPWKIIKRASTSSGDLVFILETMKDNALPGRTEFVGTVPVTLKWSPPNIDDMGSNVLEDIIREFDV